MEDYSKLLEYKEKLEKLGFDCKIEDEDSMWEESEIPFFSAYREITLKFSDEDIKVENYICNESRDNVISEQLYPCIIFSGDTPYFYGQEDVKVLSDAMAELDKIIEEVMR